MPDRALATTTANVLLGEETHERRGGGSLSHRSGSGTRCVSTDTPRHSFPQPGGYLQGRWQVPGAGVPLKSMPPVCEAPQAP